MKKIYVAFDDTDTLECGYGTGKVARWFERELPEPCQMRGVIRHQLLVDDAIPYTSHNSALCMIVETPDYTFIEDLIDRAARHLSTHFIEGSDPGLCVACEGTHLSALINFGQCCTTRKVSQRDALASATHVHLSGHGGTDDGIIGAAAAVGLTLLGQSGRFIEYGHARRLRDFPVHLQAGELRQHGMQPISVDRNAPWVLDADVIDNGGWLRPRLWGEQAVIPVLPDGPCRWKTLGRKQRHPKQGNENISSGT